MTRRASTAPAVLAVLFAGCGRIDFVPRDGALSSDAPTDTIADATSSVCPAGFALVAGDATLGTQDFCAMLTEARAWLDSNSDGTITPDELDMDGCPTPACDTGWSAESGYRPVSVLPVAAEPWRSVDQITAQAACAALGTDYDLMANREWMTIMRRAEQLGENWSGGAPGSGQLVQGQTDVGTVAGGISDPSDGYSDTGNTAADPPGMGWEQRRTLYVTPDVVLWDLPGHIQEWVDWTLGPPLDGAPTPCTNAELPAFSCPGFVADDFQSSTGTYDSSHGAGSIIGGSGNATRRGGQVADLPLGIAGIYALNMNRNQTEIFSGTGFRCVYRPEVSL